MLLGKLVEFGTTSQIFTRQQKPDTENYISGNLVNTLKNNNLNH